MKIACKITRATMAIAIFCLFIYGFDAAAIDSCNTKSTTCTPTGIRSPLMPSVYTHCQPSPSHEFKCQRVAGDVGLPVLYDVNETTTCCPEMPCKTIDLTAFPCPSSPSSYGFQDAAPSFITICNYKDISPLTKAGEAFKQTIPIYLLTKTIIC